MATTGKGRDLVADNRYGAKARARAAKPAPQQPRRTRRPPPKRGLVSRFVRWVVGLVWTIF